VKGIQSLTGVKYYFSHCVLAGCGTHPDPCTGGPAVPFPLEVVDSRFPQNIGAEYTATCPRNIWSYHSVFTRNFNPDDI